MVANSYRVLVTDITVVIVGALVSLKKGLKVPILAIFLSLFGFFKLSLFQAFDLGQLFFYEMLVQSIYFHAQ